MPHLSPIIWTLLYFMVWIVFFLVILSFEYAYKSISR